MLASASSTADRSGRTGKLVRDLISHRIRDVELRRWMLFRPPWSATWLSTLVGCGGTCVLFPLGEGGGPAGEGDSVFRCCVGFGTVCSQRQTGVGGEFHDFV